MKVIAIQVTSTDAANKTTETIAVANATFAGTTDRSANNEAEDHVVSADQTAVVEQMNQNIDSVARPNDFFDKSIENLI